jgi:hypothetical protein
VNRFGPGRLRRSGRRVDLSRPGDRKAVVALAIAAALALLIWSPSIGGRAPGDPAAIAGDARFARCRVALSDVEYGFTIPHGRDYQQYLPAMPRTSELEIDPPALVVILRAGATLGEAPSSPSAGRPAGGQSDTIRDLCIYVGVAGQGELNFYSGISIAGLRVVPGGPALVPAAQT